MNTHDHDIPEALGEAPAFWLSRQGEILDANQAALSLFAAPNAAPAGLRLEDLGFDSNKEGGLDAFWSALDEGGAAAFTVRPVAEAAAGTMLHGVAYRAPDAQIALCLVRNAASRQEVLEALARTERNLRAVLDASADFVLLVDAEGRMLDINNSVVRSLGEDRAALSGASMFGFIPPLLAASRRRRLKEVVDSRSLVRFIDGRDGRTFEHHFYPILNDAGEVERVAAYSRDITAKMQAEEEARSARRDREAYRRNLETIFDSVPVGVVLVDASMRLMEANAEAKNICAALNMDSGPLTFSEDCPGACRTVLEQVLSRRENVHEYRTQCFSCQKGPRILNLSGALVSENQETIQGAVLVIRDVTRVAEMERRLRRRRGWRNMVGVSDAMRRTYELLDQLMEVDASVLVVGESGTGKELVAEALHYGGPRASGPLVKVNCSALSENLLESELFGHVRGAFTGALRDKVGRFQAADGGAIFLDEIGDVSPLIQLKLLRFLESREFERVGESQTRTVDVRVIAATNADLPRKVAQGAFRADLYYRLKVLEVRLPPLRERREDIPVLAEHFLEAFEKRYHKPLLKLEDQALHRLLDHQWPGNVRELKHCLEHAAIICQEGRIAAADLPLPPPGQEILAPEPPAPRRRSRLDEQSVAEALRQTNGNKSEAARLLGVHRRTLYRFLQNGKDQG
ncbi:MAG: sigma 54-interacting transcriptional regulator [Desulfovibrionaceae bacterium]